MVYIGLPAYVLVAAFTLRDIVRSNSAAVAGLAAVAVGVFSGVFLDLALGLGPRKSRRRLLVSIGVLLALAAGLAFVGTSAVYLIAAGAMAGDGLEAAFALPIILLATAGVAASSAAYGLRLQDAFTQTFVTLMVGLFAFGASRLFEANRQLASAREELAELAVVNERLRFARDLHDLLGHTLTVIRAKSELASRVATSAPERAGKEMAEVEEIAREALVEVRETVTGYRRRTLVTEVANARTALGAAGIEGDVSVDGISPPPPLDEALGWVLREAVTNVVRHSGARHCQVRAVHDRGCVRLEVVDDGLGRPGAGGAAGYGLTGLRERLAAVGGELEVGAAEDGRGFRLVARVPVP
jgi:two-component system sensor histidine kinase DesK